MSSELGMEFGDKHQEKYAKVLETWTKKSEKVSEVSEALATKWGNDLFAALEEPVIEALSSKVAVAQWAKNGADIPTKEVLEMFSKIAAKYALSFASPDLLRRLVRSVNESDNETLVAAGKVMTPGELISRSSQTVAQIFDMAKDRFNDVMNTFQKKKKKFTGKKRWATYGDNSRHADLDGDIRDIDESFVYKKKAVKGPRPPGGNPADWSNCSCRIQYQKTNGKWIDIED